MAMPRACGIEAPQILSHTRRYLIIAYAVARGLGTRRTRQSRRDVVSVRSLGPCLIGQPAWLELRLPALSTRPGGAGFFPMRGSEGSDGAGIVVRLLPRRNVDDRLG